MKLPYRLAYFFIRLFFRCFFGLKIYGLEHFRKGAGLIASNHASFFDPPLLSISCPEEVHFLAKGDLFHIPILGRIIRVLNSHPVTRDSSDASTFRLMLRLLAEGKKLILFPEGKRSLDGELLPLEKGLPFLVEKAHCPIFPAYLKGTFEAWPPTKKFPKLWGKMICVFGSPIEWSSFEGLEKKEAREQINQRLTQSLQELKAWVDQGAQGTPP